MKKCQLKKSFAYLLMSLCGLSGSTIATGAMVSHEDFTRIVDKSIQWSQHLKDEASKGKKMDTAHVKLEMKNLQESLNEMTKAYLELSKQPAPEVAEGHFVAIKQHQIKAEAELKIFETEFGRASPDYSAMKKAAKKIQAELKDAAEAHKAELTELDVK